jgi:hypothetical protein
MTTTSKFIIFGIFISCTNIIPTSILGQLTLPLTRSGHFGEVIDITGEDIRKKLIQSALQGQDISVGLFLQQSEWPLIKIENFLIELVENNVRPKIIISIIRDYALSSGNYMLIGETFKYADKSILNEVIFLFIDRELQRAVALGNWNYVYYIFTDPTCRQYISLEHVENAFKNLLRCPNHVTKHTIDTFLRHQWAQRAVNIIASPEDVFFGG